MTKLIKHPFKTVETLFFLALTILALIDHSLSVFYLIYLFWMQEFIRTLVDSAIILKRAQGISARFNLLRTIFPSFFVLKIYLVFIIVLFGFMLNLKQTDIMVDNLSVFFFQNWYFNIYILLFFVEYVIMRIRYPNEDIEVVPFNYRHIIIHVSIILGAFIQMSFVMRLNLEST